jgi:uncharacterized protein
MSPDLKSQIACMLNKKLFVMVREPVAATSVDDLLKEHLIWMVQEEKKGHIFLSGPFTASGIPPGTLGGLTIINAATLEEAVRIAEQDPLVTKSGLKFEMKEWTVMEGGFSLTITLSDRKIKLD